MYKRERISDNFDYISNYEDFYGDKNTKRGKGSKKKEPSKEGKRFKKVTIAGTKSEHRKKGKFRIFLKTIFFLTILGFGTLAFSKLFYNLEGYLKPVNLEQYDDLIWPVVLQDPPEFDEKVPLDNETMLRSSVWDASFRLKEKEELFDENGRLMVSTDELQGSNEKLFGKKLELENFENSDENFFMFDKEKKIFLVDSISADERPLPKTVSAKVSKNKTRLKVEYFTPDKESTEPEKTMKYLLKRGDSGKEYIAGVKNIKDSAI